ncbi:MAG TPA: glycoside hydrolase family 31, partial [Rhodanobacter sp.]
MARRMLASALASALLVSVPALSATAPVVTAARVDAQGAAFRLGADQVSIRLDGAGVVHVQALPSGGADAHTLVLDPHAKPAAGAQAHDDGSTLTLASDRLTAVWHKQANTLDLQDAQHRPLLTLDL